MIFITTVFRTRSLTLIDISSLKVIVHLTNAMNLSKYIYNWGCSYYASTASSIIGNIFSEHYSSIIGKNAV